MPGHKGGDGATPFGGFIYDDQSQQVTGGTVKVTYGNGQTAEASFAVDPNTHQASVAGSQFSPPNPTNVTEVEFSTVPMFPANTEYAASGLDPADPMAGHFAIHAHGITQGAGPAGEYFNCCNVDRQT